MRAYVRACVHACVGGCVRAWLSFSSRAIGATSSASAVRQARNAKREKKELNYMQNEKIYVREL